MDNRGVSPVVEKTVAIGLVALFTGGLLTTLLGGAVPDYRSSVGQEVGDRVLATAASEIERSVPTTESDVSIRRERSVPGTISGASYRLGLTNRTLVLRHPDPAIGGSTRVAVPTDVTVRDGIWSGGDFVVTVSGDAANRTLAVGEGGS